MRLELRKLTSHQQQRAETIEGATGSVMDTPYDDAAVEVAEYLIDLATAVRLWARTPGNHGGNPYTLAMVNLAEGLGNYSDGVDE